MGYPKETRGYYVYYPSDNKVFVVINGFFLEKDFIISGISPNIIDFVSKRDSGSKIDLEEVQDPQDTLEAQTETREEPQGVVETPLSNTRTTKV